MIATAGAAVELTDSAPVPVEGILLTAANDAGNFAIGAGGHLGGWMPLPGPERLCLFANCDAAPSANITVPLTPVGPINIAVAGAPWTTGTATAVGLGTTMLAGYAHGPAPATGSTAQVGGSPHLIKPFTIASSIPADGPNTGRHSSQPARDSPPRDREHRPRSRSPWTMPTEQALQQARSLIWRGTVPHPGQPLGDNVSPLFAVVPAGLCDERGIGWPASLLSAPKPRRAAPS